MTILAFLRLSTSSRIFEQPLSMVEAELAVTSWFAAPSVAVLDPGERYWEILRVLLREAQVAAALVTDAALAAIALEHGATIATTDRDFARFPKLETVNPVTV